jgi:hypothetical protein
MTKLLNFTQLQQVYLVCGKTDLRKGIDGLATIVQEEFALDPFSRHCSCFAEHGKIDLKQSSGKAMALSFYTNAMNLAISNGHEPRQKSVN